MKLFNIFVPIAIATLFISSASPVKNRYLLSKDYTVTILGTSNLHNWNETVGTVFGDGYATWNDDGSCNLDAISLRMEVSSLKSDMGSIMDGNTKRALKESNYPEISFTLTNAVNSISLSASETIITAKGTLFIAGVNKQIEMQIKISAPNHNSLNFEGSQIIKMTDYGISPPTALLGTLKTGNEITINFKTVFTITSN